MPGTVTVVRCWSTSARREGAVCTALARWPMRNAASCGWSATTGRVTAARHLTPVPVLLLHGGQDRAVPFSHGQWLASHIPKVEAWFFPDEGHCLREPHIEDVDAWLIERSS
jgi:pimeloyl-ACP methyl ester carboxylesterase